MNNGTHLSNEHSFSEAEVVALIKKQILNQVYPVGSIYISANKESPESFLGGKWKQIKGRFLYSTGANEANTTNSWGTYNANSFNFSAGERGGTAETALTNAQLPSLTGGSSVICYWGSKPAEGNYSNGILNFEGQANGEFFYPDGWDSSSPGRRPAYMSIHIGGGAKHTNMPPYLVVYMWQRTA